VLSAILRTLIATVGVRAAANKHMDFAVMDTAQGYQRPLNIHFGAREFSFDEGVRAPFLRASGWSVAKVGRTTGPRNSLDWIATQFS